MDRAYQLLKKTVAYSELIYLITLPYMAALGVAIMGKPGFAVIIWAGWLMLVMHQYIHIPFAMKGFRNKNENLFLPLIPIVLIALKQVAHDGSVWNFFLEEMLLESVSMMVAFAGMFLFGKGISGESAWKGLGPFMVILVVALFLGSTAGFVLAWWESVYEQELWVIAPFAIAFVFAIWYKFKLILGIKDGEYNPDNFYGKGSNFMFIVLHIFLWLIGLTVLGVVLGLT